MQELEKILKEIEQRIEKERKIITGHHHDEMANDIAETFAEAFIEAYEECQDIIRKHMNDGWISVDKRLPEGRTRVICQFDNGDIELLWQDWESDPESLTYWTDFDFMAEKKVIAWRELPEPYRLERSEE